MEMVYLQAFSAAND